MKLENAGHSTDMGRMVGAFSEPSMKSLRLCDMKVVVNSRPLNYVSEDFGELMPQSMVAVGTWMNFN